MRSGLSRSSRAVQIPTKFGDTPSAFQAEASITGVTAGASTPNWLIEQVVEKLRAIGKTEEAVA